MTTTTPRQCFWIPVEPYDERGWVPSLVTEGVAGHQPLSGHGAQAQPWFWGRSYQQAQITAERENARTFGLSPAECAAIVASSVGAGNPPLPDPAEAFAPGMTVRHKVTGCYGEIASAPDGQVAVSYFGEGYDDDPPLVISDEDARANLEIVPGIPGNPRVL